MNKPLTHPLKSWQFYLECIRYAGSGLLGVIGDAGTILAAGIFGFKPETSEELTAKE